MNTGNGKGKTTAALGVVMRAWLDTHKPRMLHLIITGRDALPELVEYADLVTEMREVKHPYTQPGIKA